MLYEWLLPLADEYAAFNLFRYLTFRSGGALFTALILGLFLGPWMIRRLSGMQEEGQPLRADGPPSHLLTKKGTPTMGGLLMLFAGLVATLLWADLTNGYVWIVLGVLLGFGLLGAMDDMLKLTRRTHNGMSARVKLIGQWSIAAVACYAVMEQAAPSQATHLAVPFVKDFLWNMGWFYLIFAMVVVVGASNAVNLTDGLDGLAIVPVMIACGCFGLISWLVGNAVFAEYLQLHPVPGSGDLMVVCAAMIGAGLAFLWYNAPPAQVFMGDTGSLALGGVLGIVSVITKHELVLAIVGGLFVMETLSVMIQVAYFKLTGKRVFLMAPIHHHFEKKGWSEPTIVVRFWIIAVVFALIGLATLKLR